MQTRSKAVTTLGLLTVITAAFLLAASPGASRSIDWSMDALGKSHDVTWKSAKATGADVRVSKLLCASNATTIFIYGYNATHLYMLTGVQGYPEKGSGEQFVARLKGSCSEYDTALVPTGDIESRTLYDGNEGSPGAASELAPGEMLVPVGIALQVNTPDGYVKDIAIARRAGTAGGVGGAVHLSRFSMGSALPARAASWPAGTASAAVQAALDRATGPFSGDAVYLGCSAGEALAGIRLWVDMATDKIRGLQASCRSIHL